MSIDEALTNSHKIVQAVTIAAGAAASTAISGAIIDMEDFEHVTFVVSFGPIVSGAATSFKVARGATSNMADAADIVGTSITVADDFDNKIKYINVLRPGERYVQLLVSRATQAATLFALAILYGARKKPVSQPADVEGETHKDAIEGTA